MVPYKICRIDSNPSSEPLCFSISSRRFWLRRVIKVIICVEERNFGERWKLCFNIWKCPSFAHIIRWRVPLFTLLNWELNQLLHHGWIITYFNDSVFRFTCCILFLASTTILPPQPSPLSHWSSIARTPLCFPKLSNIGLLQRYSPALPPCTYLEGSRHCRSSIKNSNAKSRAYIHVFKCHTALPCCRIYLAPGPLP